MTISIIQSDVYSLYLNSDADMRYSTLSYREENVYLM